MMKSVFEQNGGTYSISGDYSIPNLTVPTDPECHIGIWGRRWLNYLKTHRRILYINLLTSGNLTDHLCEVDAVAYERRETLIRQMTQAQAVRKAIHDTLADITGIPQAPVVSNQEKYTMTTKQLAERMQISLPRAYDITHIHDFPVIELGNRRLIPIAAFERWLDENAGKKLW